jgi:hypothetical protein
MLRISIDSLSIARSALAKLSYRTHSWIVAVEAIAIVDSAGRIGIVVAPVFTSSSTCTTELPNFSRIPALSGLVRAVTVRVVPLRATAGVAVVIVILVWFGAALVSRVGDTNT